MRIKNIFMIFAMFLLVAPMALAADDDSNDLEPCEAEVSDIVKVINRITSLVVYVGGSLAVLAATVVGIMMFNAHDPTQKDNLKERLKYIIIGLVIIVVAPLIVKYVMGSAFNACSP